MSLIVHSRVGRSVGPSCLLKQAQTTPMTFSRPGYQGHLQSALTNGVFTPEQDDDKTKVEPVHSYDAFRTRHVGPGVKGIIGMRRFKICLVVVLLWCENTMTVVVLLVVYAGDTTLTWILVCLKLSVLDVRLLWLFCLYSHYMI